MAKVWPRIILDPVHRIIKFENDAPDRLLLDLINTREFQRLRRIKQLGFSHLVFPGPDHTRFSHSLGVLHIARQFLERIKRIAPGEVGDEQAKLFLAAALLHDVGHGPFSHVFEKVAVVKGGHERRTEEIIKSDESEVNVKLKNHGREFPERLAMFFDKTVGVEQLEHEGIPAFLTQIISSQLDADRFDYLLRDSYATGTDYGTFDHAWLINHLHLDKGENCFYLDRKAFSAAEAYVFARYHMYRSVYFHKTVRAAEVMLLELLRYYGERLEAAEDEMEARMIVPEAPDTVVRACRNDMNLCQFLELDDSTLMEFMKACSRSSDGVLKQLGSGLVNRRLYKATDASGVSEGGVADFTTRAGDMLRQRTGSCREVLLCDTPSDKPYAPDPEERATQIRVEDIHSNIVELSELSKPVEALKNYTLLRYYYPERYREEVDKIASETLGRERR